MRLHLPKGLLAALLGAVCTTAVMAAENKEFTGDWTVTEATEVAQLKVNTGNATITMTGDGAITAASFLRFSSWSTDSLTIQGGSLNITGEAKTDANYQQTLDLINTKISLGQGLNFMTWGSANPSAVNVNGSEVSLGGTIRATVGSAQLNFVTANSTIDVSGLTAAAYGSLVTPTAGTNGFCSSNFRYTLADSTVSTTIAEGVTVTVKNGTETIGTLTSADNGQGLYFIKTGTNTTYYIGNENVTWTDATGATALWVAENLTVEGGNSVPNSVTKFDISAKSTLFMDSLSGEKTVNGEGKLSVGTLSDTTTISGSGHIDITGNISLSDKSLTLQNSAAGSMVTFYGTNALKMIDMKGQNGVTAHLTLAAGSSTTLVYPTDNGQGLWMSGTSTLDIRMKDDGLSKEGGKLIFGTNATISATDRNASISSTGDKYTFEATSFTLTDAEFRANATAAAITLKNKLVNAIVVNDSTNDLTIENATNTLRGVDASGGNIKFAANAEVTGSIKIADGKSVIVNSGAVLTHDGFSYEDSTIKTADSAHDLSLVNNAVITGGTLTQTANISDTVQYKAIQSSLTDVKLVNTTGLELHLESDASLSGMDIGGKLQVSSATTVSGASSVSGTVEVTSGKSLTMESTATLSGEGTLKNSGGTITVKDASGFHGTFETTGGQMDVDLTAQGSTKKLVGVTATGGSINVMNAASLTVVDMVISNGATVGVYSEADATTEGNLNITGYDGKIDDKSGAYIEEPYKASLTIGSGARLNANLLVYRATLDFSGNTLAMGSTLTLIAGSASELLNIPTLNAGQSLTLFTGVDSFSTSWDPAQATTDVVTVDAHEIFGNLTTGTYSLKYTGAAAGGDVLLIANNPTPEPTTATLSLLALMGLAARRRRRKA